MGRGREGGGGGGSWGGVGQSAFSRSDASRTATRLLDRAHARANVPHGLEGEIPLGASVSGLPSASFNATTRGRLEAGKYNVQWEEGPVDQIARNLSRPEAQRTLVRQMRSARVTRDSRGHWKDTAKRIAATGRGEAPD
jgi:hypothetical protein